jgi:hypothetical protein
LAGWHPFRSCLDQQAENIEAGVLGEGGKRRYGIHLFHISIFMEKW